MAPARMSLLLEQELREGLEALASQQGVTLSAATRLVLARGLASYAQAGEESKAAEAQLLKEARREARGAAREALERALAEAFPGVEA